MIQHYFSRQFLKFLFVGGLAAFLHWSARILLSWWLPFSGAVVLAYIIGLSVAFILNYRFVFESQEIRWHKQARDFVVINLLFLPVVWGCTLLFNRWLQEGSLKEYSEPIAHACAIPIPMFATFLIYKFLTFKSRSHEQH